MALLVVGWVFVARDHGVLYVDTRPDLYLAPGRLIRDCLHSWSSGSSLGAPNYDLGYLPPALLLWGVTGVGTPAWLAMRLWRLLLFVVAAWGAERFACRTFGGVWTGTGRWTVALGYAATPFALVGAASTPVMLPMALLPWLVTAFQACLRRRGWRYVPVFGLLVFWMGGMNAGVVDVFLLLALPLVLVDARLRGRLSWRDLFARTATAVLGALLASAYWMVGTALAFSSASTVASTTESPVTIATTSSYAEVLRGLGGWLVYGADRSGPFSPGTAAYLTNTVTVLLTFLLPVLAMVGLLVARSRAIWLPWMFVVAGAVVMVGMYPPSSPTLLGRLLRAGFDDVPGLIALRTTNKAGPILVLGLSAMAGLAVERALRRWTWSVRLPLTVVLVLLWSVPVLPALRADFLANPLQMPSYWTSAAKDLSHTGDDGRVWLVPGETNALYRWRGRGVDDFASYVIARPSIYRRTFPDVPGLSANLLAAVDNDLQTRRLSPGELAAAARYLGVSDLLVRNDMRWESVHGARPAHVMAAVERDPGLEAKAIYGFPGSNVVALGRLGQLPSADRREAQLAPLFRYAVTDPGSYVRTQPSAGHVLVVGDNAGAMAVAGDGLLLDGTRPFELAASLKPEQVESLLASGARVVLTDSNRRREANDRALDRAGPILPATSVLSSTRALFGAEDQTVALYGDAASVVASSSGSIFGPEASGRVGLAFDGDPSTSWQFGDFRSAVGDSVTVDLGTRLPVNEVRVTVKDTSPAKVSQVRVLAGSRAAGLDFTSKDTAVARFPRGTEAQTVDISVTKTSGKGSNQVGISEISIDDLDLSERVRLPLTLDRLAESDSKIEDLLEVTPLDVALRREFGMEDERSLRREFSLPVDRTFRVTGVASGVREFHRGVGASRDRRACVTVGSLDGDPVRVRLDRRRADDTATFEQCGVDRPLSKGTHAFEPDTDLRVDSLQLSDVQVQERELVDHPPEVTSWSGDPSHLSIQVAASDKPFFLVVAESYDDRWQASIAGKRLDGPVVSDGYALGWWVDAGPARAIDVRYGPQRAYTAALWLSVLSVLGFAGWTIHLGWRRVSGALVALRPRSEVSRD
ncbi:MAG: alpha-(1-_3)-arabinofuranosyltransferase family protein [Nocardioidaceae bacterium]